MRNSLKAGVVLFLFAICCNTLLSFKSANFECGLFKKGTFHFYKDNGRYHSIITRKDSLQTETNLITGDTTYWRIGWISDCEFTCKYISGSKVKSQQEIDFYNQSTLKFNITNSTKDYYTWDAVLTYNNASRNFSDTMWLHEK